MTFDRWRKILTAWAQGEEHKQRVADALALVEQAIARANRAYVAYSGGKDSTVVAHLALEAQPDIMILHWDYGPYFIPRWLADEIRTNARQLGVRHLRIETSPEYLRLRRKAVNVLGREYLGKLLPRLRQEGYDVGFTGIRAEESLKRRRRYSLSYPMKGITTYAPLFDWTWRDVWAYIFSRDLPYASIYERYADAQGLENVRFATFFDPEFKHIGVPDLDGVLMWRDRHTSAASGPQRRKSRRRHAPGPARLPGGGPRSGTSPRPP